MPERSAIDRMIFAVVAGNYRPTADDVAALRAHVANAPFTSAAELARHRDRRIRQQQWSGEVTPDEYLADLRRAVEHADRIAVFVRYAETFASFHCTTAAAVRHPGDAAELYCLVIYSVDRGRLITGYQYDSLGEIDLPRRLRWLV